MCKLISCIRVLHMNEGHSAFASLERLAQTISGHNVDLKTALEIVPRTTVFTTHTPVAAGHEEFAVDLVRPYLKPLENSGLKKVRTISAGQGEVNLREMGKKKREPGPFLFQKFPGKKG